MKRFFWLLPVFSLFSLTALATQEDPKACMAAKLAKLVKRANEHEIDLDYKWAAINDAVDIGTLEDFLANKIPAGATRKLTTKDALDLLEGLDFPKNDPVARERYYRAEFEVLNRHYDESLAAAENLMRKADANKGLTRDERLDLEDHLKVLWNIGVSRTNRVKDMESIAESVPDLESRFRALENKFRPKYYSMVEKLEELKGKRKYRTVEERVRLRTLSDFPSAKDMDERLKAVEAALAAGDGDFAGDLLATINHSLTFRSFTELLEKDSGRSNDALKRKHRVPMIEVPSEEYNALVSRFEALKKRVYSSEQ